MPRILRIIALGCGLAGAALASQGPEFAQQYRQRLGGAIDELTRIVTRFEGDARANGLTREDAAARLRANADDLVSRQGIAMQGNMDRLTRLQSHRRVMAEAGPFGRMALLVRDGDVDLMRGAWAEFEPALPITEEGIVAALAGFAVAWGAVLLLTGLIRGLFRRRPVRLPAPVPSPRLRGEG
ncbi:MAG TPA: DUF2937 family protein [Microvirga sp.]|nr:DUF2937 family protein [Microvirga sp.]